MNIHLIAAIGQQNELGKSNKLLIHLPKDMLYFKNKTWGLPVIMGRKTFESLNFKPLQGRINIVLTKELSAEKTIVEEKYKPLLRYATNMNECLEIISSIKSKEVFVIGGGSIYNLFLPLCKNLYLTRIKKDFEADTFFPKIDFKEWNLLSISSQLRDENHEVNFDFEIWRKK